MLNTDLYTPINNHEGFVKINHSIYYLRGKYPNAGISNKNHGVYLAVELLHAIRTVLLYGKEEKTNE